MKTKVFKVTASTKKTSLLERKGRYKKNGRVKIMRG